MGSKADAVRADHEDLESLLPKDEIVDANPSDEQTKLNNTILKQTTKRRKVTKEANNITT